MILAKSVQHVKANPTFAFISCLAFRLPRIYLQKQFPLLWLLHPLLLSVIWWIAPAASPQLAHTSPLHHLSGGLLPPRPWVSDTSFAPSSMCPTLLDPEGLTKVLPLCPKSHHSAAALSLFTGFGPWPSQQTPLLSALMDSLIPSQIIPLHPLYARFHVQCHKVRNQHRRTLNSTSASCVWNCATPTAKWQTLSFL